MQYYMLIFKSKDIKVNLKNIIKFIKQTKCFKRRLDGAQINKPSRILLKKLIISTNFNFSKLNKEIIKKYKPKKNKNIENNNTYTVPHSHYTKKIRSHCSQDKIKGLDGAQIKNATNHQNQY